MRYLSFFGKLDFIYMIINAIKGEDMTASKTIVEGNEFYTNEYETE